MNDSPSPNALTPLSAQQRFLGREKSQSLRTALIFAVLSGLLFFASAHPISPFWDMQADIGAGLLALLAMWSVGRWTQASRLLSWTSQNDITPEQLLRTAQQLDAALPGEALPHPMATPPVPSSQASAARQAGEDSEDCCSLPVRPMPALPGVPAPTSGTQVMQQLHVRAYASVQEARELGWVFGPQQGFFGGESVPAWAECEGRRFVFDGLASGNTLSGVVPEHVRVFGRLRYVQPTANATGPTLAL